MHLGERECSIQRRHQKLRRGGAFGRRLSPAPARDGHGRGLGRRRRRISRGRHLRVPSRRRRRILFPGDEHEDPGRAPGDRIRLRSGPGSRAAANRSRQADDSVGVADGSPWPFHRMPHHQRRPLQRIPAVDRENPRTSGRPRDPRYAGTAASRPETRSPSTTTRCSPSWWCTPRIARPRSGGCGARLGELVIVGVATNQGLHRAVARRSGIPAWGSGHPVPGAREDLLAAAPTPRAPAGSPLPPPWRKRSAATAASPRSRARRDAAGEWGRAGRHEGAPVSEAVRIRSIAAGGDGVGTLDDGRTVFVPRTAPGDLAELKVLSLARRFARARIDRLIESSSERAAPPCPHYNKDDCGGCQLQHLHRGCSAERAATAGGRCAATDRPTRRGGAATGAKRP